MNQSPPVGWLVRPDYRRNDSKTPYLKGVRRPGTDPERTLVGSPRDGRLRSAGQISVMATGPPMGAGAGRRGSAKASSGDLVAHHPFALRRRLRGAAAAYPR